MLGSLVVYAAKDPFSARSSGSSRVWSVPEVASAILIAGALTVNLRYSRGPWWPVDANAVPARCCRHDRIRRLIPASGNCSGRSASSSGQVIAGLRPLVLAMFG